MALSTSLRIQSLRRSPEVGEVLSTLLPGAIVVFALRSWVPTLHEWFTRLEELGPGVALLMASAVAGGVLEAVTRVTWEPWVLTRRCPPVSVLPRLREHPLHPELYERGVQSSYKYVTFYANVAWALGVLAVAEVSGARRWPWIALLVIVMAILMRASLVQWTYYVNYQTQGNNIVDASR